MAADTFPDTKCPYCGEESIKEDDKTHQKFCTECRQVIPVQDKD